jgi:hypothetical protein
MLNKEQILSFNDVKIEKVSVPEWGTDVYVRSISAKQQDSWSDELRKNKDSKPNFQASFLVLCVCDESGNLLFGKTDADMLGEKSASALNRLFNVASKLNGLSSEDVKELEKNSLQTQSEDSISS